ncbi:MAG: hypothetical protein PHW95_01515 [Patescibacteria group bacterium]|nr:hypothetical protein [Patescibacteria group bacterium]
MKKGLIYTPVKYIAIGLVGDVLYWPIWWYTVGLVKTLKMCFREIAAQESRLGLSIWAKNIFTPMFGQYDVEGRIISFFARLIQIIYRSVLLLVWSIFVMIILIVWIFTPFFVVYQIYYLFLN